MLAPNTTRTHASLRGKALILLPTALYLQQWSVFVKLRVTECSWASPQQWLMYRYHCIQTVESTLFSGIDPIGITAVAHTYLTTTVHGLALF